MNTMTRTSAGWLLAGLCAVAAFAVPVSAAAFVSTSGFPIDMDNILPGWSTSGTFTIENATTTPAANAYIETGGHSGNFLLAEHMHLLITQDGETYFDDAFSTFLSTTTPSTFLGNLPLGSSRTYTFTLSFNSDAPQEGLMGTKINFDLLVGLEQGSVSGGGDEKEETSRTRRSAINRISGSEPLTSARAPDAPASFFGGVGGGVAFSGAGSGDLTGTRGSEEDEESAEGQEGNDGLFEDLGSPTIDQAAAVGLAGFFGEFTAECVSVFILVLLLLALAWRVIESMYRRNEVDTRSALERNRYALLSLGLIGVIIALLAYWFPCIRWATLVAVIVFALCILWRDRMKRNR